MKRGYNLLRLWCSNCKRDRSFNHIARWQSPQKNVVKKVNGKYQKLPSPNPVPNVDDDIRLISGVCMVCDTKASFVISEEAWEESHHSIDDLCGCGLPRSHKGLHLGVLRERFASGRRTVENL